MSRTADLLEYLPPVLKDVREMAAVAQAENPELSRLWEALDQALDDQFLSSASRYGVARWEKILGLSPKGSDSLETRKTRILLRLGERLPYTLSVLRAWLEAACGPEYCQVLLDHLAYLLHVQVNSESGADYADVLRYLHKVVPANLVLDFLIVTQVIAEAGGIWAGGFHSVGAEITIHPYQAGEGSYQAGAFAGSALETASLVRIVPGEPGPVPLRRPWPWAPPSPLGKDDITNE